MPESVAVLTDDSALPVTAMSPSDDPAHDHPEPLETSGERTLDNIVEALLLAADSPLSLDALQRLVGDELNVSKSDLRVALQRLDERLAGSAAELAEVAGGWRIQVRGEYGRWVSRLWQEKPPKLSRATLETLALIVYRQPTTRGEIEDVRGVAVSPNILRTLLERGWIREVGYKEVPGRPALFGTTQQFLNDFNLRSLDQLPPLPELKDMAQLEAALARLAPPSAEGAGTDASAEDAAAAAPSSVAADETAPDRSAEAEIAGDEPPRADRSADGQPEGAPAEDESAMDKSTEGKSTQGELAESEPDDSEPDESEQAAGEQAAGEQADEPDSGPAGAR
jgi:segregation and condensation protein B